MAKDKSMKGKIKRAIKRAKKAKKKPKTIKRIGQQQTQKVVLNLSDTGKRGGFGISASTFPTIIQRDTSDISTGLGNILTELREQKRQVLELQRTQKPPMFYQARTPMRTEAPTQTTFMRYDDQLGTFPASTWRPVGSGEEIEETWRDMSSEFQTEEEMTPIPTIETTLKEDLPTESGFLEAEAKKPRATTITALRAKNMTTEDLLLKENRNKRSVIRELASRGLDKRGNPLVAEGD
jgi:hypothetical protein